jgi:predicted AAA+ superfamily ATPase
MDINYLITLNNLAKEDGATNKQKRFIYTELTNHKDKTFLGLLGPRGVGKSILLKQLLADEDSAFYISLDSLDADTDIFKLVYDLHKNYKFNCFLLDEVHFIKDINKHLKLIFDNLKVRLYFTSSIALKLVESAHDLSRRVKIIKINTFSFSEFLYFKYAEKYEKINWEDILKGNFTTKHIESLPSLKYYLIGGCYPLSLDVKDVKSALKANLEKVIFADIPKLQVLTTEELPLILKTFQFIRRSPISDLNPSTISNNLQITRYKANQYINLLEQAFILKTIYPSGANVMKEPKILCHLPYRLLESSYEQVIGGLREDFAVSCFINAEFDVNYLKSKRGEKTPDFIVKAKGIKPVIVEIGGAGKSFSQFKNIDEKIKKVIFADHSDVERNTIPLGILGFLE